MYPLSHRGLIAFGWGTGMSASAAKLVYGIGLLFLAAFAVMPQSQARVAATVAAAPMLSAEDRLARTIHERIAIEATGQRRDAEILKMRAQEDLLRRLAFEDDVSKSRAILIDALADALSAAMLTHAALAADGEENPAALDRAHAVVRRLTAAINDEVRSLAT
jgi:hypothetical protein